MRIHWQCTEEKIGWRIYAELSLPHGVRICVDHTISRSEMTETLFWLSIESIQNSIEAKRRAAE